VLRGCFAFRGRSPPRGGAPFWDCSGLPRIRSVDDMLTAPVTAPALTEHALEQGVERVLAAKTGMPAFVITERAGMRELHEFATERTGQSAGAARFFLRSSADLDRAVIVWDGYVMSMGKRIDAVLAEYTERGAAESVITACRYRPASLLRKAAALPGIVHVGEGHPLF
jgi:hypothetical protein